MDGQTDCIVIDAIGPFSMCWDGCTYDKHDYHNGMLPPHYPVPALRIEVIKADDFSCILTVDKETCNGFSFYREEDNNWPMCWYD